MINQRYVHRCIVILLIALKDLTSHFISQIHPHTLSTNIGFTTPSITIITPLISISQSPSILIPLLFIIHIHAWSHQPIYQSHLFHSRYNKSPNKPHPQTSYSYSLNPCTSTILSIAFTHTYIHHAIPHTQLSMPSKRLGGSPYSTLIQRLGCWDIGMDILIEMCNMSMYVYILSYSRNIYTYK